MSKQFGLGALCGVALAFGCNAPSDSEIAQAVESHLSSDAQLASNSIEASVRDGKVTLLGAVDSSAEKDRARDIAESVQGVKSVENELTVGTPPAPPPSVSTPPPSESPAESPSAPDGSMPPPAMGTGPETSAPTEEPGATSERKPSNDIGGPPATETPDQDTQKAPLPQ